jgi:hypothetical protein
MLRLRTDSNADGNGHSHDQLEANLASRLRCIIVTKPDVCCA